MIAAGSPAAKRATAPVDAPPSRRAMTSSRIALFVWNSLRSRAVVRLTGSVNASLPGTPYSAVASSGDIVMGYGSVFLSMSRNKREVGFSANVCRNCAPSTSPVVDGMRSVPCASASELPISPSVNSPTLLIAAAPTGRAVSVAIHGRGARRAAPFPRAAPWA